MLHHRGDAVSCPICGHHFCGVSRRLEPPRRDLLALRRPRAPPGAVALPRAPPQLLAGAPGRCCTSRRNGAWSTGCARLRRLRYVTADLDPAKGQLQLDITRLELPGRFVRRDSLQPRARARRGRSRRDARAAPRARTRRLDDRDGAARPRPASADTRLSSMREPGSASVGRPRDPDGHRAAAGIPRAPTPRRSTPRACRRLSGTSTCSRRSMAVVSSGSTRSTANAPGRGAGATGAGRSGGALPAAAPVGVGGSALCGVHLACLRLSSRHWMSEKMTMIVGKKVIATNIALVITLSFVSPYSPARHRSPRPTPAQSSATSHEHEQRGDDPGAAHRPEGYRIDAASRLLGTAFRWRARRRSGR